MDSRIAATLFRRELRKEINQCIASRLKRNLDTRYSSSLKSVAFWSGTKCLFKPASASLYAFASPVGEIVRKSNEMVDIAAEHYKQLYSAPTVIRPHSYVDAPPVIWDNDDEPITPVIVHEVLKGVAFRGKKLSCDAHGLSTFIQKFLLPQYWILFTQLFNMSFTTCFFPSSLKNVRIILLAKKESICSVSNTRAISLLDIFLKLIERLFVTRFLNALSRRRILPDTQSDFRSNFRLQTKVLLPIEQISSLMSNSSSVATVFVDYKQVFDQLWFDDCIGKLNSLGIPRAYVNWNYARLRGRRAFIEIDGVKSKWIPIERGGPQRPSLTLAVFITYHSDMDLLIQKCTSFHFADDLAATIVGHIAAKYLDQCLDLERRLKKFLENLEYYSRGSIFRCSRPFEFRLCPQDRLH